MSGKRHEDSQFIDLAENGLKKAQVNHFDSSRLKKPRFRDIARRIGADFPVNDIQTVLKIINDGTFTKDNIISTPNKHLNQYVVKDIDTFPEPCDLSDVIVDVFKKPDGTLPANVTVLSEAEGRNPEGITVFSLEDFRNQVVPYIYEFGGLKNYWATDGEKTVTVHNSGVVYWKK